MPISNPKPAAELTPAATVVLLRDASHGVETLLLRKSAKIQFGGLWVFPGGRIDATDQHESGEMLRAARVAAVREAEEEAGLKLDPDQFVWMSHWVAPPIRVKRFSTWFFLARAPEQHEVSVDGGEIDDHRWIRPAEALQRVDRGEIDVVAPTWVTLHYLSHHDHAASALEHFAAREPRKYRTHLFEMEEGHVTMWRGDAGYEALDPSLPGARHRLTITGKRHRFEDSGAT